MSESKIWFCKIGEVDAAKIPEGGDLPMRQAVEEAYFDLTGETAKFNFSGWGATLDEGERAVVENREPSPEHYAEWRKREAAPELFEAVRRMLPYFEGEHAYDHPCSVQARAALAKASPEQSE